LDATADWILTEILVPDGTYSGTNLAHKPEGPAQYPKGILASCTTSAVDAPNPISMRVLVLVALTNPAWTESQKPSQALVVEATIPLQALFACGVAEAFTFCAPGIELLRVP